MSKEVHTEIYIAASPEAVWEILTGLDLYQDWNPVITSSSGIVEIGETLTNRLELPGGRARTFSVQVTPVDRTHLFAWSGRLLGMPWLFEGRHIFKLENTPQGTRLIHSEEFSGLAGSLILRKSLFGTDRGGLHGNEQGIEDPGRSPNNEHVAGDFQTTRSATTDPALWGRSPRADRIRTLRGRPPPHTPIGTHPDHAGTGLGRLGPTR